MNRWAWLPVLAALPAILGAQNVQRCGNSTGIVIEAVSSSDSIAPARKLVVPSALDSTWVFNIAQRSWPLGHIEAAINANWANAAGNSRICSGVTLSMDQAVLTVQGARGTVRFQASLADLQK